MRSVVSSAMLWLWLGAATGLGLAIASLAKPANNRTGRVPADAVALVNGEPISRVDYAIALQKLHASVEAQTATDAPNAQVALDTLIGEELMLEYAQRLGLARSDPGARQALLSAVFSAERAAADAREPTPEELASLYASTRTSYARTGKLHVRQLVVRARTRAERAEARQRAEQAALLLQSGTSMSELRAQFEAVGEPQLPDQPLSAAALRSALGPIAAAVAMRLEPGQTSAILGEGDSLRILQLIDAQPTEIPTLEEIRPQLIARFRQHAGDQAIARRLVELRKGAVIRIADSLR
jgi:hypothetical protein